MDKAQVIHNFWSSFEWPAYDEGTVPDEAGYPRITYNLATDELDKPVLMYASLWDNSSSWERISKKAEEIAEAINTMVPPAIPFDGGRVFITKGTPFAQRMIHEEDTVRRIYINITVEYFSAY